MKGLVGKKEEGVQRTRGSQTESVATIEAPWWLRRMERGRGVVAGTTATMVWVLGKKKEKVSCGDGIGLAKKKKKRAL
jgi:hypothetical protein